MTTSYIEICKKIEIDILPELLPKLEEERENTGYSSGLILAVYRSDIISPEEQEFPGYQMERSEPFSSISLYDDDVIEKLFDIATGLYRDGATLCDGLEGKITHGSYQLTPKKSVKMKPDLGGRHHSPANISNYRNEDDILIAPVVYIISTNNGSSMKRYFMGEESSLDDKFDWNLLEQELMK